MVSPAYLNVREGAVCIAVRVQPRASRNEIGEVLGKELKIKITAPPVDSAANEALVEFLAEKVGCPRSAIKIMRGHASRHKQVMIVGISADEIARKLQRLE